MEGSCGYMGSAASAYVRNELDGVARSTLARSGSQESKAIFAFSSNHHHTVQPTDAGLLILS